MDIPIYITISSRSSTDSNSCHEKTAAKIKHSRSTSHLWLAGDATTSLVDESPPLRRTASLDYAPNKYPVTTNIKQVDLIPRIPQRSEESCCCPPRLPERQGSFGKLPVIWSKEVTNVQATKRTIRRTVLKKARTCRQTK